MSQPLKLYYFDLETLLNFFSFAGKFHGERKVYSFEISERRNKKQELLNHLSFLQNSGVTMCGYNNIPFDYPILHDLLINPYTFGFEKAYQLCKQIIASQGNERFLNQIGLKDRIIPQLDLMKLNHFDNRNKSTSLKALEFAMRMSNIEGMPVEMDVAITHEQMDKVHFYNGWDLNATELFATKCMKHILIRKELLDTGTLMGDVMNFSDVKLGTEFFVKKIGRSKCFSGSTPRQTFRPSVEFKNIILPKVNFKTEAFQQVLEWFNKQIVYTKSEEEKPHLECKLAGLDFNFGVGGAHASVENKKYESNISHVIRDVDVSGMYPAIAIANGFYPEHLGQDFVLAYKQLQTDRSQYKKGSTMNLILKLASNGVFGNSDNAYSCFYDPAYAKKVTVNGQLQLLQLVEFFSLIPGIEIIQANTDGVTVYMPRSISYLFDLWKTDWECATGLKLEDNEYSKMWIRDVNNYLAIDITGKIKAKGAYWYPKEEEDYWGGSGSVWNKDFSMMVVQKVIEQTLINDWNPEALLPVMSDPFDFMIRYKTPSGASVFIGDKQMDKTVRYYVSTDGAPMKKIAKPKGKIGDFKRRNGLSDGEYNKIRAEIPESVWDERIHTKNKSKYEKVETNIENGRLVKECNDASKFNWKDVDYDYYLGEIKKLYIGEQHV